MSYNHGGGPGPWILRNVHERVPDLKVHVRWESFAEEQSGLLLWGGVCRGTGKGRDEREDARNGVQAPLLAAVGVRTVGGRAL
jgi:hypothetical protein